jgi:hypothetical protein
MFVHGRARGALTKGGSFFSLFDAHRLAWLLQVGLPIVVRWRAVCLNPATLTPSLCLLAARHK